MWKCRNDFFIFGIYCRISEEIRSAFIISYKEILSLKQIKKFVAIFSKQKKKHATLFHSHFTAGAPSASRREMKQNK